MSIGLKGEPMGRFPLCGNDRGRVSRAPLDEDAGVGVIIVLASPRGSEERRPETIKGQADRLAEITVNENLQRPGRAVCVDRGPHEHAPGMLTLAPRARSDGV